MQMKKLYTFCWIILSVLSLASCSSDADSSSNVTLLKKIQSVDLGQNAVHNFYYKGTKLTKVTFDIQGQTNGKGYDKYSYINDLISEIKTFSSNNQLLSVITLTYNNLNQLTEVVKIEPSRNYGLKTVFDYSTNNTVIAQTFSGNTSAQDNPSNQTTTFLLQNDEVVSKSFASADMNYSIEYVYDDKNNPFKNVTGYHAIKLYAILNNGLLGLNHNLLKQTTYFDANVIDSQIDFELNYNQDNFPTLRYATGEFSGVYQYVYEYY